MDELTTDVVVVGSGAGGLLAAVTARRLGRDVLVLESTELIGGSSAMSGGAMWLPDNPYLAGLGESDSFEKARAYLDEILGPPRPGSTPERRDAYVRTAPELVAWMEQLGMRLEAAAGYPDYYPEAQGGMAQGRSVECQVTDTGIVGPWAERMRITIPVALKGSEAPKFATSLRTPRGFWTAAKVLGGRTLLGRLRGHHNVACGGALVTQLLKACLDAGVTLWTESPLLSLVENGGRIAGVLVRHGETEVKITARHGVLLAAGGFERNQSMREEFLPQPTDAAWSSGNPGNVGDAVRLGMAVGAATDLLDDAWWGPSFLFADGTSHFALWERTLPHSIIVDSSGNRYFNEAEPYADAGHHMYARHPRQSAVPSFLIVDSRHRNRYPMGLWPPGYTPKKAMADGDVVVARTLISLANKLGIDAAGLVGGVARFNGFVKKGKDLDFGRGASLYDRYYADPTVKPNPSLGSIEKPPFYALRVYPGDLGTKGGLVTDERARVLRPDGSAIEGLYATGNCTASVMARSYPGAGGTLGPAVIFGYLAARDLAS